MGRDAECVIPEFIQCRFYYISYIFWMQLFRVVVCCTRGLHMSSPGPWASAQPSLRARPEPSNR